MRHAGSRTQSDGGAVLWELKPHSVAGVDRSLPSCRLGEEARGLTAGIEATITSTLGRWLRILATRLCLVQLSSPAPSIRAPSGPETATIAEAFHSAVLVSPLELTRGTEQKARLHLNYRARASPSALSATPSAARNPRRQKPSLVSGPQSVIPTRPTPCHARDSPPPTPGIPCLRRKSSSSSVSSRGFAFPIPRKRETDARARRVPAPKPGSDNENLACPRYWVSVSGTITYPLVCAPSAGAALNVTSTTRALGDAEPAPFPRQTIPASGSWRSRVRPFGTQAHKGVGLLRGKSALAHRHR